MSLRRGLQVVVGAIRRRVLQHQQQQVEAQVHARQKKPDGVPSNASEHSLYTRGRVAGAHAQSLALSRSGVNVLQRQNYSNLASEASRIWRWSLSSRARFPQANGSGSIAASPRSPILSLLLGFACVGFVRQESNLVDGDDGKNGHHGFGHTDLETAIQTIQAVFKSHDGKHDQEEEGGLPQNVDAYSVAEQILAKGTEGVVYAAKRKATVPAEDGDAVLPCRRDNSVILEDQGRECPNPQMEICDEKECNLAVKMMFNYNVGSTPLDIVSEFHAEQLPLLLARGTFGTSTVREAKQSLSARHPNIIKMYGAFVDEVRVPSHQQALLQFDVALPQRLNPQGAGADTTLYIVMKRYTASLREHLKKTGPLPERTAMLVVAQLLEAVVYLGDRGIVHRDLKTDNILVDYEEDGQMPRVALADFGCALSLRGRSLSESIAEEDRRNPGNSALRAPEVKKAYMENTICYGDYMKADVWAIGAVAYEVCGQNNPFYSPRGLHSDSYEEQDLPKLQTQAVGLMALVRLLLQKDPHKRLSADVAADMLHLFLWQPAFGGLVRLSHGQSSPERELVAWLIKVSLTYLVQDHLSRIDASSAPGLPWNWAERGLMGSFLSRVNAGDLEQAVRCAVGALRNTFPFCPELDGGHGRVDCRWDRAIWLGNSRPMVICDA